MNNKPLTIGQILSALRRHKFKSFLVWLLVFSVVVAAFLLWPRKFGSEGRIYVQLGRNNTTLTPTSGTAAVSIQDTRETEIRSVVEIIKSRAVLEATVKDIGAEKILKNGLMDLLPEISVPNFLSSGGSGGMSVEEYNELRDLELAAKELESSMTVNSEKKTSVISVYIKANSAKLAQQIVSRIFEHTRRIHLKVHAVEGSAVFFDDQFEEQEKDLVEAITKLADFRVERGVLSIGAEIDTWQGILAMLDNEILTSEINLNVAQERVKKLTKMMSTTSRLMDIPRTGVERLSYEDSKSEVFRLESEVERLSSAYSKKHPEYRQAVARLNALKGSIKGMKTDRTESAKVSNPVYEDMQVDFMRAETEAAAAKVRVENLKEKRKTALKRAQNLNRDQVESDQLLRDVEICRQYLAIYTQKRGEAKGMSLLDDRNISDVVVAQEPNFMVKHVSPKGSLIIPFGFLMGLLAALTSALFFDRNHLNTDLNEGEVEQVLNLPVLVTLPRVYSSRNMVN